MFQQKDVLSFLIENEFCSILTDTASMYDDKDFNASLRATQRHLIRRGFRRGKQKGTVKVNPKHIAQRNEYIRILLDNRSKSVQERRLKVYTDESYIHHHHCLNHHSLYHPSMRKSIEKDPNRGRRICFLLQSVEKGVQRSQA